MNHTLPIKVPNTPTPTIELLWDDGTSHIIPILSLVRGISKQGKRPIGFYYKPNQPTYGITREQFMRWLHEEFIHIFDKDSPIFATHMSAISYKES